VGHRNTYWIGTVDQISWVVAAAVAGRIIAAAAASDDKEVVSVAVKPWSDLGIHRWK